MASSERLAVIDLGTNTFHLLIFEKKGKEISHLLRRQIPVKLGEQGINMSLIQAAAYERGLLALQEFRELLTTYEVEKVKAIATSAIRNASNGRDFIKDVKEHTGIEVEAIDGKTEAGLIAAGVRQTLPSTLTKYLVMDIGGGSVEFIIHADGENLWYGSYEIGAARLLEKFHRQDPITEAEITALNAFLEEQLSGLLEQMRKHDVHELVGSAGSFESVCEMINERTDQNLLRENEFFAMIPIGDFEKIYGSLLHSTLEERLKMRGLANYRAEMIVVASCLINYILKKGNITSMYCSAYSLKEGAALSL